MEIITSLQSKPPTLAAFAKAAAEAHLCLNEKDIAQLAQLEQDCLTEQRRVSFGESAAPQLIRAFSNSPFLTGANVTQTLSELIAAFYELRSNLPASITDIEIIEALHENFNGESCGNPPEAGELALRQLQHIEQSFVYEIVDDDDRVYRWDPDEWHDDIMAKGWYGEDPYEEMAK